MNKEAINWDRVAPLLGGGLLLGGGVGASVALYKLMNRLNENREKEKSTAYDDDTLYLTVPQNEEEAEKTASDVGPTDVMVGGVGGLLAAYLGYKGVDMIYNKVRQGRLQSELDEAQNIYLKRLKETKSASIKKAFGSNLDRIGGATLAVPLLLALGSGLITNRILDKSNPAIKHKTKNNLRKIVIKSKEPRKRKKSKKEPIEEKPVEEPVEEPIVEQAAPKDSVTPEDVENLMQLSMAKSSKDKGLNDIVFDVAQNGISTLKQNTKDFGLFTAMDMAKGASTEKTISSKEKQAAIREIVNDPFLQDSVALHVASEYFDMAPTICKNATFVPQADADALVDFQREAYLEISNTNMSEKKAAAGLALGLINNEIRSGEDEEMRGLQMGSSQDSSNVVGDSDPDANMIDGVHVDPADEHAEEFLDKYRDIIDAALDVK